MKSPLEGGARWLILDEVGSTQDVAAKLLQEGEDYGVVFARDQKTGRGRMSREWVSAPGDSLTMSLIFRGYPNHPHPHLIGMSVALAAALTIGAHVQWPNDLTIGRKKVGGILTELRSNPDGDLVAVVGLGINLNQSAFADSISHRAISLLQAFGRPYEAQTLAARIVEKLRDIPEPNSWQNLSSAWSSIDETAGKSYLAPDGTVLEAVGVGPGGELLCKSEGKTASVLAADAIFGRPSSC